MIKRRGLLLLIASALLLYTIQLGRVSLSDKRQPAEFVMYESGQIIVELGRGFCPEGVVQKSDALLVGGVIEMTCEPEARSALATILALEPPQSGERFEISTKAQQQWAVERSWMAASRQIELGIPLQADRLDFADWCDLPGVGPALATAILQDRQQNGDFGSYRQLNRVNGVGPGKIAAWEKIFKEP